MNLLTEKIPLASLALYMANDINSSLTKLIAMADSSPEIFCEPDVYEKAMPMWVELVTKLEIYSDLAKTYNITESLIDLIRDKRDEWNTLLESVAIGEELEL